jgi:hypothetical protein
VTYDRLDWHIDSDLEAGQPPENGFTHIGLYLGWLIRHDLHDGAFFPADHVDAVKAGQMTGSDLADDIDNKLVAPFMTAEGRAFSDACYGAYTAEFEAAFAGATPYSIADDEASRARIDPVLDGLYTGWVANGRPARVETLAQPDPSWVLDTEDMARLQTSIDRIAEDLRPSRAASLAPHAALALEALIPADLTDPPMDLTTVTAVEWGSSLLRRSLKRLAVPPGDALVAYGMGGHGEETLTVVLFGVRGVDQARLLAEFRSVIFAAGRSWQTKLVAGREVEWIAIPEFTTAFWATDGLVVHVSGRADLVEAAIPRLP